MHLLLAQASTTSLHAAEGGESERYNQRKAALYKILEKVRKYIKRTQRVQ